MTTHSCVIAVMAAAAAAVEARPPNVLFMLTDDQRADALSLAGHPHLQAKHGPH